MSLELNNQNYLKLLHAMIRQDGSLSEPERSRDVLLWATDKGSALGKILTFEQRRLMGLMIEYFRSHQKAPSLVILRHRVETADKGQGMEDLLKEYEGIDFPEYTKYDADALFVEIAAEWKKYHFGSILEQAMRINVMGVQGDPKKREKDLSGPEDARMYMLKELQSPLFANEAVNIGGSMAETADQLIGNYEANKKAAHGNTLFIPTGVPHLDRTIHGLSRGTLNLILGTAGQRKSAVARTFAYNAAWAGFRVLFIPLEITFADELTAFGIIHAHNPDAFENRLEFSIENYRHGKLTQAEEIALRDVVVPDLKERIGNRLSAKQLTDTTWENIRSVIELENFIDPLDLVVIDYIGLIDTRHQKDKTLAINDVAIQMKQMALTFPNGRGGLTIVTPAQGSRKGYEDAKNNDGVWDKTGIFMYSELEKSADIVFYTFLPIELQQTGKIKLGTCKSRNTADAAGELVPIDLRTGYVGRNPEGSDNQDLLPAERPKHDEEMVY